MGNNRGLVLLILVIVILVGIGVAVYSQGSQVITSFEKNRPLPGAVLYDQNGMVIKRLGQGSVFIPLNKMPKSLPDAVEVTQDQRFNKEHGLTDGKMQTITQRVARLMLEPKNTWERLKFMVLPIALERRYSNQELIEIYLNQTYFGQGAHGVEAASQTYFGKSIEEVDLAESALLVALALEPEAASPFKNPKQATQLRDGILAQMQKEGKIEKTQYEKAIATPLELEQREPGQAHYFADYLSGILVDKLGEERVFQGGLKIETTLDLELQKTAEQILLEHNLPGAVVIIDPQDGRILTMVGG
ncbi:MAG: hypothetical protein GX956_00150, partial [Firmicutes bacterium]|nr:hypothetical protein [Bacillota bacterium]